MKLGITAYRLLHLILLLHLRFNLYEKCTSYGENLESDFGVADATSVTDARIGHYMLAQICKKMLSLSIGRNKIQVSYYFDIYGVK